jgi:hypothetical protein
MAYTHQPNFKISRSEVDAGLSELENNDKNIIFLPGPLLSDNLKYYMS